MGNNSIKENLSNKDTISTIKLFLFADIKREKSVFIVEGTDDIHFWRSKVSKNVYLEESPSGKSGVRNIIEHFSDARVIGICDQDYDWKYSNEYVFHYDFSCLEMMLLSSDITCKSFFDGYYSNNKTIDIIRMEVLNNIIWFSCCRMLNFLNDWGMNFKFFSFHNSFDETKMCFDYQKALLELQRLNPKFMEKYGDKISQINAEASKEFSLLDLLKLTNGHDFLSYFHCLCNHQEKQKVKADGMSISLRCAFRMDDLKRTKIYSDIKKYEAQHNVLFLDS